MSYTQQVLYTAAHGMEGSENLPLGGGAAICRQLCEEWVRTRPFELRVLKPETPGADLVRFSELQYARFCLAFQRTTTEEVLRHDPKRTVVLCNDVSEGPDFQRLAGAGFPIVTIYHVDVVAYICNIYCHGMVRPETTVRWFEHLRKLPLPGILRLIWDKQRDSVRYSRRLVVPSAEMKHVLERCYPQDAPGKVCVVPWGVRPAAPVRPEQVSALRREFRLPLDAQVLLTLSRISPEKGQDLLLEALLQWERQPGFPQTPVALFVCGAPAFMQGERHLQRLESLAARLRKVQVFFPGHVTGERKQAFFQMADLYVFPSIHESYGLTLLEALSAGLPAVCLDHHGAREVMRPEFGEMTPHGSRAQSIEGLWRAVERLLHDEPLRQRMGHAARNYAAQHGFAAAAGALAQIVLECAGPRPGGL